MKYLLILVFVFLNCMNAMNPLQVGNSSLDPQTFLDIIDPKNEALIAGLTPNEVGIVLAVASLPSEEAQTTEPDPEPVWTPEPRWIHLFGADGNLIIDGDFRYEERVADDHPFELRLRMYNTQAQSMNRPVASGGDARCTCTVRHGGQGNGI